jgi:hypothetical protein
MTKFLQLTIWKASRLPQHTEELELFISMHDIDIMPISETHFTGKNYLKIPKYTVYHIHHPAGTAIIIKSSIQYHLLSNYSQDFLEATGVTVEDTVGLSFYNTLETTMLNWRSRLISPRG